MASEEGASERLSARLFKGRPVRPLPRRLCGRPWLALPGGVVGTGTTLSGLFTSKTEFAIFHTFLPLSEEWARNESFSKALCVWPLGLLRFENL